MMKKIMEAAGNGIFNVLDYGAVGDATTVNTGAIQAALDACGKAGGGTVVVPAGCFVTGTIWLRSHVELHLTPGAVLKASPDLADYNKLDAYPQNFMSREEEWNGAHLILGIEVEDVSITGPGTIDGNGKVFFCGPIPLPYSAYIWRDGLALAKDKENLRPGQTIVFCESRNIRIRDLAIRDATCWCIFLYGCEDVLVRGLNIRNASTAANTDGIDVDCCRNVTISDCLIDTGDDAITLRADTVRLKNKNRICENITVTNCVVGSSSSVFRIGVGDGVIRNALFSNIVITRGGIGLHFQSAFWPGPGVAISNVTFRDVVARDVALPFHISPGKPEATARIENIVIDGYHAEVFADAAVAGNSRTRPRNIQLRNIQLTVVPHPGQLGPGWKDQPDTLLRIRAADDVTLENVRVEWRTDAKHWKRTLVSEDVAGLKTGADCRLTEPAGEVRKILFLGNSITLHGPKADIGWTDNFGMAASALEKDYVHLLLQRFAAAAGGRAPEALVRNIADFEREYSTYPIETKLKDVAGFKADTVFLCIGENVPKLATQAEQERFKAAVKQLLALVKGEGSPALYVRSSFWPDAVKDGILKQVCLELGGIFVEISRLADEEKNYARSERTFSHDGVAAHPGDAGMAAIAEAIWSAVAGGNP